MRIILKLARELLDQLKIFRLKRLGILELAEHAKFLPRRFIESRECRLRIGCDSNLSCSIVMERPGVVVTIGERTFIGDSSLICASGAHIGDDVLISWGVTIVDHDSHSILFSERANDVVDWGRGVKDWANVKISRVVIGNKVWIGFNAMLLKGVKIGEGAVIGAGSVVTKDVAPWTVVAGNPARVIKNLYKSE
jgi:acetyltransferase-like isoleucine patch superfamily enzyme